MKALALIALLALSGCSTIDRYVGGWPQGLRVTVHKATLAEIQTVCRSGMVFACAAVDFEALTCDIYTLSGEPRGYAYEHELAHCNGGDHDGIMQAGFDAWIDGKIRALDEKKAR